MQRWQTIPLCQRKFDPAVQGGFEFFQNTAFSIGKYNQPLKAGDPGGITFTFSEEFYFGQF